MKKLTTLQTRRQTWHNVELYATAEEARAQGFALMYEDDRGTVYGIRSTDADKPHTFARVAFVPDPVNLQWYLAEAIDEPAATLTHIIRDHNGATLAIYNNGTAKAITPKEVKQIAELPYIGEKDTATAEARRIVEDWERGERQQKEADENRETCKRIAEELNDYAAGLVRCPHCERTHYPHDFEENENEDGETVYTCPDCGGTIDDLDALSLYDYIADALDIEYTIDSQGELKACRVWLGLGGPNICIDTTRRAVCLYWWGNSAEYPIDCADEVDEIAAEMWEAIR